MKRLIPVLGLIPNTEINQRLCEQETRFAAIAAKMLIESLTDYCIYKNTSLEKLPLFFL